MQRRAVGYLIEWFLTGQVLEHHVLLRCTMVITTVGAGSGH